MRKGVPGGPQAAPLRDPSNPVRWASLYLSSAWRARRGLPVDDVERFCFFIGYARSGHSIIGSLLNAHREIVISHELDVVRFLEKGFSRRQLYALILHRDEVFGAMNRTWTGYDYNVPDQYQGTFERLRVMGDKRGRTTALELAGRPELLARLRRTVGVPIRAVHITRNPFDNIATEAIRRNFPLSVATRWFDKSCRAVAAVRPMLTPGELLDMAHERFTADPKSSLSELCTFLGVEARPAFLEDCASIVWRSTKRRRDAVDWSKDEREAVESLIARYDFFDGYTFDS